MKMAWKLMFYLSSVILVAGQCSSPNVTVTNGIIQGSWKLSTNGRQYASFEGIPYADPPIGEYRFREPQQLTDWVGVWNASQPSSVCLQYDLVVDNVTGSEDCLYLNIATPNPDVNASLPVLIFIHGGAFMYGAGNLYSPEHVMDRDMVVVTFNYRLGPLGFLSTGDQAAPGNAGLKDQAFALHWVKDNINMFGGNPDSITLIGQSAGGSSVHYHYLSPLSNGTFHRGIAFSGSALDPWAYATKPLQKAETLASLVGCPTTSTDEMVKCLRSESAENVVNAQIDMLDWRIHLFGPFVPTMEPDDLEEPAFLTQYPYLAMQAGCMAKLPLITTVTSEEGLYPAATYQANSTILPELESGWENLTCNIFEYNDTLPLNLRAEVAAEIKQQYLDGEAVSEDTFSQLVQALGDRLFVVGAGKLAQLHANTSGQPTYLYRYAFRASVSLSNVLANNNVNYGVSHLDDLNLILKYLPMNANTTQDIKMSDALLDMVYSYADTGVPELANGTEWIPVEPGCSELNYLSITEPDDMQMQTSTDFGHQFFWDSLGFTENEQYDLNDDR